MIEKVVMANSRHGNMANFFIFKIHNNFDLSCVNVKSEKC